jgi:hypothetical protein
MVGLDGVGVSVVTLLEIGGGHGVGSIGRLGWKVYE